MPKVLGSTPSASAVPIQRSGQAWTTEYLKTVEATDYSKLAPQPWTAQTANTARANRSDRRHEQPLAQRQRCDSTTHTLPDSRHQGNRPPRCPRATQATSLLGVALAPRKTHYSACRLGTIATQKYCPHEYLRLDYTISENICPANYRAQSSGSQNLGHHTRRVSYQLTCASMRIHYQIAEAHVHRPLISARKLIQNGHTRFTKTRRIHISRRMASENHYATAGTVLSGFEYDTTYGQTYQAISSTAVQSLERLLIKDYLVAKTDASYRRRVKT